MLPGAPVYAGRPDFQVYQDLSHGTTAEDAKSPDFYDAKILLNSF